MNNTETGFFLCMEFVWFVYRLERHIARYEMLG